MRAGYDQLPLQTPFATLSQIFNGPQINKATSLFPQAHFMVDIQALNTEHNESLPSRLVGLLPKAKKSRQGYTPINKLGQRLDIFFPHPNAAARKEFYDRFPAGTKQPCNWHLLSKNCRNTAPCPYDHSDVTQNILLYRRFQTSIIPCANGSKCRRADCFYGHLCRRQKCANGDVEGCTMLAFHQVDPEVARWVKGSMLDTTIA